MTIALLTDFGTGDYFVGAMKGIILTIDRKAQIVDISHDLPPQDIRAACFTLDACYKNFPENTIFVAVVDPGVGSKRRAIVVETQKYKFVAPDNGLLSFIFNGEDAFRVFEIQNKEFFLKPTSNTFHGRDIFAPVAANLSKGTEPAEFGQELKDFARIEQPKPRFVSPDGLKARIIHVDHFGNLVTNLTENDLPERFSLSVRGRTIEKVKNCYSESADGEVFLILGSAGYFELAANRDSAKDLLRASVNDLITIKIL